MLDHIELKQNHWLISNLRYDKLVELADIMKVDLVLGRVLVRVNMIA